MRKYARCFLAIVAIGVALMTPIRMASADSENKAFADSKNNASDSESLKQLSAEWEQWALQIPTPENPMYDITGDNCMIGQHGPIWFLAGVFNRFNGGRARRTCSVPEGKSLYFPVINAVNINAPNVCGQGPDNISAKDLRAADFVDVFLGPLGPCGKSSPGGVYSPGVDDGFYVLLKPLSVGSHALHFYAESPAGTLAQDITYNLNVVPILKK